MPKTGLFFKLSLIFLSVISVLSLINGCGGGGGVRSAYPEEAKDIAGTRLDEAEFADLVVTACPFCVSNLTSGAEGRKMKIIDLTELVDAHL
ncbi:MAG TPA: heterodisulfide reductase-related iron-sulfur binding cluster [Candidatus Wallbacteria bacterium]|nr:heterodisulfide reductase-related iron-sulfur binding cluster [Candidatus Wallbacteria bacterium]